MSPASQVPAHLLPPPRPHPRVARRFQSKILTREEGREISKGTKKIKRKEEKKRKRKKIIQLSSPQILIKSNDLESKNLEEQVKTGKVKLVCHH